MSQGTLFPDNSSPAADVEFLTGDVGGPVGPDAGFNINLLTGVGLTSTGVPVANTITWTLDGANEGTGSTIGAVTTDLITINLGATPTTYVFDIQVSGFESTTPAGAGYNIFGAVRTTGAAAVLIGTPDKIAHEDAALTAGDADLVVSGNTAIIRVTGTSGLTVNWRAFSTYRKVA